MFDLEIQKLQNIEVVLKYAHNRQVPYALDMAELDDDAAVWLIITHLPIITDHDDHIREWRMLPGSHPYCIVVTKSTLPDFVRFLKHHSTAQGKQLGLSSCEQPTRGVDRWIVNVWVRPNDTPAKRTTHNFDPSTR